MDKIMGKELSAQENGSDHRKHLMEKLSEIIYKVDMGNARMEQSAFDSINTTDRVMHQLMDTVELLKQIMEAQGNLVNAIEFCSLTADSKEGSELLKLAHQQIDNFQELELSFHNAAEAAAEANDAARVIETGVAEQSECLTEFLRLSSKLEEF